MSLPIYWRRPRGSWGGPRAPGPRPAPPRDGRPRPTPAPRRISPDTVCRHRPIRRAMRAAQVPLRQARGDHGPRQRPPGAGPDRRPRHPRVGSPMIRWPPGAPAPTSAPDLTAMPGARRRQRGGRGHSYAYRATTCPRPGSTRPRPGRPRPARPRPPRPRTPPACAGRPPGRLAPTAPIASPTPASRAHRPTAVRQHAPAPEPPPTPTSHPRSAPSPAGAPHPATLTPRGTSTTPPNP